MTSADYERRVQAMEAEGMTRSDAQGVVDAEDLQSPNVTTTCPCGTSLPVPLTEQGYDVCSVECHACGRLSTGGNGRTGIVDGWVTAKSAAQSQAAYEAMQFDVDMNEWYGRGNW